MLCFVANKPSCKNVVEIRIMVTDLLNLLTVVVVLLEPLLCLNGIEHLLKKISIKAA